MFKKRLIAYILFFILLIVVYVCITENDLNSENTSLSVNIKKVEFIEINNKALSKEYIPYLRGLNSLKIISFSEEYLDLFGLRESNADKIEIFYNDGSSLNIYSGKLNNDRTNVYIRLENSDSVYECDKLLLNIINEKPDSLKEYSLLDSIPLNSVIAIKIISNLMNISVIKDIDNIWIDQNSGFEMNQLKIQNLINRILNLRALKYKSELDNLRFTQFIEIETSTGQSFSLKISPDKNNNYLIQNERGILYFLDNKKMDFMEIDLTQLQ
jgi:hypothetical protein